MANKPPSAFAPKTLAMFSLVDGFDLVAKAVVFLPLASMLLTDNLTLVLIHAYAWIIPSTLPYSRLIFFSRSLRRTGKIEKRFSTATKVPLWLATTAVSRTWPDLWKLRRVPLGTSSARAVTICRSERAHREERASPRKPKVWRESRSS